MLYLADVERQAMVKATESFLIQLCLGLGTVLGTFLFPIKYRGIVCYFLLFQRYKSLA